MNKKRLYAVVSVVAAMAMLPGCGLSGSGTSSSSAASTEAAAAAEATTESAQTEAAEVSSEYTVNEAAAADPAVVLTMAELNALDGTICGMTDSKFKEAVEAISGGSMTIDIRPNGVLGAEADILDGMIGGTSTVDIARITASSLVSYGCDKIALTSLPYMFNDRAHYWDFVASDVGQEILNESEELGVGVRGLFFGEEGTRNFFTVEDKPVSTPEDMQGLKIRSSADPIMSGMIANLGSTPSPVSFSEVYSCLQNGTIDGAEQPVANYKSNSFQEVGPNLTLDGHTLGVIEIIISDTAYDKLTENQQQVLADASGIAMDYCAEISEQLEQEVIQELKDDGVNVIEVADKAAWREACQPIIDEYVTEDLQDLYDQIIAMGN